jgi:hypothetical protein
MPQIVELDLATSEQELARFHLADEPQVRPAHWLLGAWYGRDFLKVALKKHRADLKVRQYVHAPELDDYLEMTIDRLDLRDWRSPRTAVEQARYLISVGVMFAALSRGETSMKRYAR